jgi:phytoene dehydrogenase-like protein
MHGDVPPDNSGSAISAIYLKVLGHVVGWPSPEGGAARLADALTAVLHEAGGESRTGVRVAEVLTERNRVAGVRTADGGVVRARIVVCDTTPRGLLALAEDALPDAYVRRLVAFRYGPSTVKVDWALDGPVPWSAELPRRAGTVHLGGTAGEITEAIASSERGVLPEYPFLLFGQQSVADPTRAPAGKHTAWAYTHVPRAVDWATQRDGFVGRMEAQVERFAPGFADRVLARHVMDPGDLQARNDNLEHGDVGGGSYALDQLVFRPVPSLSPYRTPLRGLYLGSASTFPGGAVHGVPGDAAGRAALQDSKLRRV